MLSEKARADLARSGITHKQAKRAGLFSVGKASDIHSDFKSLEALIIPYFAADGSPFEYAEDQPFCRVRYIEEPPPRHSFGKQKFLRYSQPKGSGVWPYFPPVDDWQEIAADPTVPVAITEGEKKAIVGTLAGVPTIGLGGVFNFMREEALLPDLDAFTWENRPVYICFDSDADSNPNIQAAEGRLATELSLRRKATLFLARTPALADGVKAGLDDFVVAKGEDAWLSLLEGASPMRRIDRAVLAMNEHVAWIEREGMVLDLTSFQLLKRDNFTRGSKYSAYELIVPGPKSTVKRISVASEWLRHPHAQRYDEMLFRPEQEGTVIDLDYGGRALNTWRGLTSKQGDVSPFLRLYDHVMKDVDPKLQDLLFKLVTYKAQNPDKKIPIGPLLIGTQGSGKSLLIDCFREAFGKYGIDVSPDAFESEFNDWMEQSLVATVNEVEPNQLKGKGGGRLFSAITDKRQQMAAKYRPTRQIECYTFLMISTNKTKAASFSADDRRMFVISCPGMHPDPDFYTHIFQWREEGGPYALMDYMLNHDLKGWRPPRRAPMTAEKHMAYMENLTPAQRVAEDIKKADDHVVYLWIEQAMAWAQTAELSNDPAKMQAAKGVQNLQHISIRPWYSVDELAGIFPMIAAELYNDRARKHYVGGEISNQLRDSGVKYLRNTDDPRGFMWRGRIQQFLVMADPDEWGKPISQADFDYYMARFPRFKEFKQRLKEKS